MRSTACGSSPMSRSAKVRLMMAISSSPTGPQMPVAPSSVSMSKKRASTGYGGPPAGYQGEHAGGAIPARGRCSPGGRGGLRRAARDSPTRRRRASCERGQSSWLYSSKLKTQFQLSDQNPSLALRRLPHIHPRRTPADPPPRHGRRMRDKYRICSAAHSSVSGNSSAAPIARIISSSRASSSAICAR